MTPKVKTVVITDRLLVFKAIMQIPGVEEVYGLFQSTDGKTLKRWVEDRGFDPDGKHLDVVFISSRSAEDASDTVKIIASSGRVPRCVFDVRAGEVPGDLATFEKVVSYAKPPIGIMPTKPESDPLAPSAPRPRQAPRSDYSHVPPKQEPAKEKKTLQTQSAADLQKKNIPPIRWVVPGLIPEGLMVLSGRPKMGKSYAALGLAISVASGGVALGKFKVDAPNDVLYFAMEDSERRMQARVNQLTFDQPAPSGLHFAYSENMVGLSISEVVSDWLEQNPKTKLVIIDTLGAVRGAAKKGSDLYAEDYAFMRSLQAPAHKHGAAVVVVHHQSKAKVTDVFDAIAGTTGISGAADTLAILAKPADGELMAGCLHVRGRDVPETTWRMTRDADQGWVITGETEDDGGSSLSSGRVAVLEALKKGPLSSSQIRQIIGGSSEGAKKMIRRMLQDRIIAQETFRGLYFIPLSSSNDCIEEEKKEKCPLSPQSLLSPQSPQSPQVEGTEGTQGTFRCPQPKQALLAPEGDEGTQGTQGTPTVKNRIGRSEV